MKKRLFAVALFATALLFTLGCILYAYSFYSVVTYHVNKSFYYLVLDELHIQASTVEVQYDGGAGYLLEYNDKEYIALAVYLREENGQNAQTAVASVYEDAQIIKVDSGTLYMKENTQKKNAPIILGALESLYGCMQVLEREIARLANGATQSSSKRILEEIKNNLQYLSKENAEAFPSYSVVCESASIALSEYTKDIIYAQDLRFLLCELCVSYTQLSEEFSL